MHDVGEMTPEELKAMAREAPEGARVERKRAYTDHHAVKRTVCAFANDLEGRGELGVIFIGLEDDGRCAGLQVDDRLIRDLAAIRDDGSILPRPSIQVVRLDLDGCEVAALIVSPSLEPPVRYQRRVWVRIGSTTREATPEEERRLSERRRAHDRSFDMRPAPDATLKDLDVAWIESTYVPAAIAPDILQRNSRPLEARLEGLRLTDHGMPTYGALIMAGIDPLRWVPGAYVQFLRIDGNELGDPIMDEKRLQGPLHEIARELDELLRLNIRTAVDLKSGDRERRVPDYPLAALQQYVRNALIHRDYEVSNAPVRINWFVDRVEIGNPGGLFGRVNRDNFGRGATDYRNPFIAEAMAVLGYVQRFGYGIPTAERALRENGNPPPEYIFEATQFLVAVWGRR